MNDFLILHFIVRGQWALYALLIIAVFIGGLCSIHAKNGTSKVNRSVYWVWLALASLFISIASLVWILTMVSIVGGYFWAVVLLAALSMAAYGYVVGRISISRSRDITGDASLAWMGFIPFANLRLIFSKGDTVHAETVKPIKSKLASYARIAIGFIVFMMASLIGKLTEHNINTTNSDTYRTAEIIDRVRVKHSSAQELASSFFDGLTLPMKIDEHTELVRVIKLDGNINLIYKLSGNYNPPTVPFFEKIVRYGCDDPDIKRFVDNDINIKFTYIDQKTTEIGSAVSNKESCANPTLGITIKNPTKSLENLLNENSGLLGTEALDLLRSAYASEYNSFVKSLDVNELVKNGGLGAKLAAFTTMISDKNKNYRRLAQDQDLKNYINQHISILVAVSYDQALCAEVITHGVGALPPETFKQIPAAFQIAVMNLRTMVSGRDNPVYRNSPSDQNWDDFFREFLQHGGTEADLTTVTTGSSADGSSCMSFIKFFQTVANSNLDGADLIRAEMVSNM